MAGLKLQEAEYYANSKLEDDEQQEWTCKVCNEFLIVNGETPIAHRHLLPFTEPNCPICFERMKAVSTINGRTNFQCMNRQCTNLRRFDSNGNQLGDK